MDKEAKQPAEKAPEGVILRVDDEWTSAICTFAEQIPPQTEIPVEDTLFLTVQHDVRRYQHAGQEYVSYSANLSFRRTACQHHAAGVSEVVIRPDGVVIERHDSTGDPSGVFTPFATAITEQNRTELYLCWTIEAAARLAHPRKQEQSLDSSK